MTYIRALPVLLVLVGSGLLLVAFGSTTRILEELPIGSLRSRWRYSGD